MRFNPLVSVIIPTFNSAKSLPATVESVTNQTYNNIEVIIIDDGSTDKTSSLFNDFRNKNINCISVENGGASRARNLGLEKATGEYIQFLDADDLLHPCKIDQQIKTMLSIKSQISFSTWSFLYDDYQKDYTFQFNEIDYSKTRSGKELLLSFGMDNWFMPVFCWLTSKTLIEKAGLWDESLTNNDDGEYFTRILFNADKVICVDKILGFYRQSEAASLSNYSNKEKIDSAYRSYKKIEKLIRSNKQIDLLCYPKRQFYIQYRMLKRKFPELAMRAAKEFDSIEGDCFLIKKKRLWWCVQNFGLEKGIVFYNLLLKGSKIYRKLR